MTLSATPARVGSASTAAGASMDGRMAGLSPEGLDDMGDCLCDDAAVAVVALISLFDVTWSFCPSSCAADSVSICACKLSMSCCIASNSCSSLSISSRT